MFQSAKARLLLCGSIKPWCYLINFSRFNPLKRVFFSAATSYAAPQVGALSFNPLKRVFFSAAGTLPSRFVGYTSFNPLKRVFFSAARPWIMA